MTGPGMVVAAGASVVLWTLGAGFVVATVTAPAPVVGWQLAGLVVGAVVALAGLGWAHYEARAAGDRP